MTIGLIAYRHRALLHIFALALLDFSLDRTRILVVGLMRQFRSTILIRTEVPTFNAGVDIYALVENGYRISHGKILPPQRDAIGRRKRRLLFLELAGKHTSHMRVGGGGHGETRA